MATVAVAGLSACTDEARSVPAHEVLTAIIKSQIEPVTGAPGPQSTGAPSPPASTASGTAVSVDGEAPLPVVYVISTGEDDIAAAAQAATAQALHDVVDVRFADDRDEALILDAPDRPVRDEGVLLAVGEIPADESGGSVEVAVEQYRSVDDRTRHVFTVAVRDDAWIVTSTSNVPTTTSA